MRFIEIFDQMKPVHDGTFGIWLFSVTAWLIYIWPMKGFPILAAIFGPSVILIASEWMYRFGEWLVDLIRRNIVAQKKD
jgi:hypothetical protein